MDSGGASPGAYVPRHPENFMSIIEFQTLGAIDLRHSGKRSLKPILSQHKRLGLLAYLCSSASLQRRDLLLALLWPELDEVHARRALRQAVYFLRIHLGEGALVAPRQEEIGIGNECIWCDAVALERAYNAGDMLTAAELYRGDFLAGFHISNAAPEFNYWLDRERFRLRGRARDASLALAKESEAEGDLPRAVYWARKVVLIDPTDEASARRLIRLLYLSDDRMEALQEYEIFVDRLRQELEIEPSDEMRILVQRIRGSRPLVGSGPVDAGLRGQVESLPRTATSLIGREREIRAVIDLLSSSDSPVVTLTGPGGIGKTRLAIEVARRACNELLANVFFVPLAPINDPERVAPAIASVFGVRDPTNGKLTERIVEKIEGRDTLLLLDNFEQVIEAKHWLLTLSRAAFPYLKILITSREVLRIAGERKFKTPPLGLPSYRIGTTSGLPLESEAVALFVERAVDVCPRFHLTSNNEDAVAEICSRLDGIPLAIELAAARTVVLSPQEILERLERRFALLKGSGSEVPRQRTLEATIRWSYDLLSHQERKLFVALAVFRGGASLAAIEAITADLLQDIEALDLLQALLDKSLLQRVEDESECSRYLMLETIHEFAIRELFASGRDAFWRDRHARHFSSWVQEGSRHYCTDDEVTWLAKLEQEQDNLRTALAWSLKHNSELAGRIAKVMWWFWWSRGYVSEGRQWTRQVLCLSDLPASLGAGVGIGAGALALAQSDFDESIDHFRRSLAFYRELGDPKGTARALQNLGFALQEKGDLDPARDCFEEALQIAQALEEESRTAVALFSLGCILRLRQDWEKAESLLRESLKLGQSIGDRGRTAQALLELGHLARDRKDLDKAEAFTEESREIFEFLGRKVDLAGALESLGELARERADFHRALEHYSQALHFYQDIGFQAGFNRVLLAIAEIGLSLGRAVWAVELLGGLGRTTRSENGSIEERFETACKLSRDQLDDVTFLKAWGRGQRLHPDHLCNLVVEETATVKLKLASK